MPRSLPFEESKDIDSIPLTELIGNLQTYELGLTRLEKASKGNNVPSGPKCFGCHGFGHMKYECPTYLKATEKSTYCNLE